MREIERHIARRQTEVSRRAETRQRAITGEMRRAFQ